VWLGVLVLCSGLQAIVTQSVLLREALVLMYGSELAWGVVLFAWLLGVAAGATIGGRTAGRMQRPEFALVAALMLLGLVGCLELWVFRGARGWLGIPAGELLPLPSTALAAVLFVSPASALVGFAFPLACAVRFADAAAKPESTAETTPRRRQWGSLPLGSVYAIESAGSLIGGAAFSFWAVENLHPIEVVLGCWGLGAAVSTGFLVRAGSRPSVGLLTALICVAALVTAALAGDTLHRQLVERRWRHVAPGYTLMAETETRYQNLAVGRRAEQFSLYSDGHIAADFPDPYTYVPLAHFWMCQHPSPRTVLMIGGGAEGLLAEFLRHPVEHVDYVEPDAKLIDLLDPFLAATDRQALADPRVTVHHTDARHYVKTQAGRFDLVIARLPEPISALRARLYTAEFFHELRRAMTRRSVVCLTAAAAPGRLSAAVAEYLASLRATLRTQFPVVAVGWGDPAHVLAASGEGLVSTDAAELARRYSDRPVKFGMFDPIWFEGATDWLDPAKIQRRAAELDAAGGVAVSTDLHPVVYVQRLALWERMTGGRRMPVFERLRSVGWIEVSLIALAFGGAALMAGWLRHRGKAGAAEWLPDGVVMLSVGSTGFATMALSIIWLFAFQNLYGYVYQRIGWIVALFMAGLVLGCGAAQWRWSGDVAPAVASTTLWRRLIVLDTIMALLAAAAPGVLMALASLQAGPAAFRLVDASISALVALTGALGGSAFAVAGALASATEQRLGASAGRVVAADHVGACLGALLCGILLVPVFGTVSAVLFLAGIKLGSVGLLLAGRRASCPPEGAGAAGRMSGR